MPCSGARWLSVYCLRDGGHWGHPPQDKCKFPGNLAIPECQQAGTLSQQGLLWAEPRGRTVGSQRIQEYVGIHWAWGRALKASPTRLSPTSARHPQFCFSAPTYAHSQPCSCTFSLTLKCSALPFPFPLGSPVLLPAHSKALLLPAGYLPSSSSITASFAFTAGNLNKLLAHKNDPLDPSTLLTKGLHRPSFLERLRCLLSCISYRTCWFFPKPFCRLCNNKSIGPTGDSGLLFLCTLFSSSHGHTSPWLTCVLSSL